MTTVSIGNKAELAVLMRLEKLGHAFIAKNWRTRTCEIDIITIKNGIVYFTEVKFRSNMNWGSGLDYITPKKLDQMEYSAKVWVHHTHYNGDYRLMAAEVTDSTYEEIEILELS